MLSFTLGTLFSRVCEEFKVGWKEVVIGEVRQGANTQVGQTVRKQTSFLTSAKFLCPRTDAMVSFLTFIVALGR